MKKRVLCFGDSNTYGYNPMGGRYDEDVRWPMVMQNILGDDYRVIEEGLNGRTFSQDDPTEGGYKSGVKYLPVCLMTHNPIDLLIVMLGTNDTKERFNMSAGVIAHNITALVKVAREYAFSQDGKPPRILIVSPIHIGDISTSPFYDHFGLGSVEKAKYLAVNCRRYAKLNGCGFFDASTCASPCKIDAVHLTPDGHKALGEVLAEKVIETFH